LEKDKRVEKLLDSLRRIREAVIVKAKEKWSSLIEKLQALMEKHRPVTEVMGVTMMTTREKQLGPIV